MRGTPKGLGAAMKGLSMITGQWPVKAKAKKSVASFKIREGNTIGIAVTLRGRIMFNFLDRLINLGLPRTMDFLGVNPNSFDGHGNASIGLGDQGVFPEIPYEVGGKKSGTDVCIVTTAKTDNEALRLLTLLGMPFRREHPVWRGDPEEEVETPPPHEQGQGKAVKAKFVSDIEWMVSLSIACCSCCTYRQKAERKSFGLVRLFTLGVSETRMFIRA